MHIHTWQHLQALVHWQRNVLCHNHQRARKTELMFCTSLDCHQIATITVRLREQWKCKIDAGYAGPLGLPTNISMEGSGQHTEQTYKQRHIESRYLCQGRCLNLAIVSRYKVIVECNLTSTLV
jgi:hypothetical protein